MKKFLIVIFSLIILFILSSSLYLTPNFNNDFKVETYIPDMSHYNGVNSVNHMFKGTTVKELEKTIKEKGYGAFVLSRVTCDHCQASMKYLNEVAEKLGVYVYYIDGESNRYPIVDTDDYDLLDELLKPIEEKLDGEYTLQTPHFFTIINGEFIDSLVGVDFDNLNKPSQNEIDKLMNEYEHALIRFKK